MISLARQTLAAARLDLGDVLRSRWPVLSLAVYVLLAAVLVLAATRESIVVEFTGMGRVLLSFAHALLLALPLLALAATVQVISRAREDGTVELLFSHPLSRTAYVLATAITRYLVLVVPLLVMIAILAVVGAVIAADDAWQVAIRASMVSAALLWAFVGLGMAISARTRNQARAVVWGLSSWAAVVALLDLALLGLLLQWRVDARAVFALAAINPVQSARMALLSGIEPDLGTLGPVGFYLTERVGADALLALGIGWPVVVGFAGCAAALRGFRKGDLV